MRLLIFGAKGQVGYELCRLSGLDGMDILGLAREDADITQPAEVDQAVGASRCDAVINAAAYTAVDRAETDSATAYTVNQDGAGNVACAAAHHGVPVVQLSTDYVFDGLKRGSYVEDDPVAPLSVYGASKAAGEQAVRVAHDRHIILRTSWVFGTQGHNFVRTMLQLAEKREAIGAVDDQWGCPTAAAELARSVTRLCHQLGPETWGTYHFCGAGRTTWFRFACEIFDQRARITGVAPPHLRPLAATECATGAQRPANSELNCTRFTAVFGISPRPWREGLAAMLEKLLT